LLLESLSENDRKGENITSYLLLKGLSEDDQQKEEAMRPLMFSLYTRRARTGETDMPKDSSPLLNVLVSAFSALARTLDNSQSLLYYCGGFGVLGFSKFTKTILKASSVKSTKRTTTGSSSLF